MNDSYQDRSIDHSPEVFELFLYENVKDNNGNILPIVKEGEKFHLEIEIKMNGKSKIYQEVFTVPKSY